jgi:hypothetical protein
VGREGRIGLCEESAHRSRVENNRWEVDMKKIALLLLFSFSVMALDAQIPDIPPNAVYFVKSEGGWDLYIKKLKGIDSIILTESQRDPAYQVTAYSLRATAKKTVNSSEKRILNGKPITTRDATVYLIDSTPEKIGTIGDFYHFFLTDEVVFGYPWARQGKMKIEAGVKINARLFEKKYGDYSGRFKDQWIVLTPEALPLEKAEVKPKPAPEQAKAETTIVLLHSSDVDTEIAPSPPPQPAPSPAPVIPAEGKTALAAAAEKLSSQVQLGRSTTSSYGYLIVEKQTRFPFERIKDTQPAGNAELQANEERVLTKFMFDVDQNRNTQSAGFATFHQDAQGRIVRINEYGRDNLLTAVYIVDYGAGAQSPTVTAYGPDGKTVSGK